MAMIDDHPPGAGGTRRLETVRAGVVRRPLLTIGLALLLLFGVIWLLNARGPLVDAAAVTRTDIEQHLVASGRVRVVNRVQLTAQAAGRVTQIAAREGQRVKPGDVLAQIDDREARAAVAEARAAAEQARGRVEQLRE